MALILIYNKQRMKKILLLLALTVNIAVAQDFSNYNFNTQYSDNLYGLIEYETGYLLTGYISDSSLAATFSWHGAAPVLIKLTKTGHPLDSLMPTNFGYTEVTYTSVYKDGYFYTFGVTNPQNDTAQMVVNKFDTSFNFIEKRIYPQIHAFNGIYNKSTKNTTDSTMYFIATHWDYTNYVLKSLILNFNFNTLNFDKIVNFPDDFVISDLIVKDNKYYVVGILIPYSKILTYDSAFNLLSSDTLFIKSILNSTVQSGISIQEYQDSLFLISGRGDLAYPVNNPTHTIKTMILETLDSNFQVIDYKYWYHDSITYFKTSMRNALSVNNNGNYFIGGTLFLNNHISPDSGLLIVKLDSNLNTLWERHIECTAKTIDLYNMLPTNDGGLLILYSEQVSLTGAQQLNSRLVKIDSTGEITSISEFKIPIQRIMPQVFPNPASSELNISLKSHKIKSLKIIDILGKEMLSKQINAQHTKLDVSELANGVYLIEGITNENKHFSDRFIKRK